MRKGREIEERDWNSASCLNLFDFSQSQVTGDIFTANLSDGGPRLEYWRTGGLLGPGKQQSLLMERCKRLWRSWGTEELGNSGHDTTIKRLPLSRTPFAVAVAIDIAFDLLFGLIVGSLWQSGSPAQCHNVIWGLRGWATASICYSYWQSVRRLWLGFSNFSRDPLDVAFQFTFTSSWLWFRPAPLAHLTFVNNSVSTGETHKHSLTRIDSDRVWRLCPNAGQKINCFSIRGRTE